MTKFGASPFSFAWYPLQAYTPKNFCRCLSVASCKQSSICDGDKTVPVDRSITVYGLILSSLLNDIAICFFKHLYQYLHYVSYINYTINYFFKVIVSILEDKWLNYFISYMSQNNQFIQSIKISKILKTVICLLSPKYRI